MQSVCDRLIYYQYVCLSYHLYFIEYNKKQIRKLAPLHRNDHCCLLLPSCSLYEKRFEYKLKRFINESTKSRLGLILSKQSWESVLRCDNVNAKVEKFHNIMDNILNDASPLKKIRVREDDPQWITPKSSI